MAKKYPTDIMAQTQGVLQSWKAMAKKMVITDLTEEDLETEFHTATPLLEEIDQARAHLTDLCNQRDSLFESLWKKLKRIRAGVKANYGDDSSEYEMIGGKRISDRKPVSRTAPSTTA